MKKIILIIIALIVVGSGAFYAGMKYGQNTRQNPVLNLRAGLDGQEQRQQFSRFLSGEVIDKDENSLTLKMPDGSSKIVFFSPSTEISKMAQGTLNDIEIGKQIMVSGQQNSDGSYTAKTINLR